MKLTSLTLLSLLAVLLSGCTGGYKTVVGSQTYAPVPLAHVSILVAFPDEGTYRVIGLVTAKGAALASNDAVYRKFRKSGADLGADAVVVGQAAMAYRGTLPGRAYSSGDVNLSQNGSGYSGYYSGSTSYTPPTPLYGLDVNGVAIKYAHDTPESPEQKQ